MEFDETFDIVIVGSGCASVTAALAAEAQGGSAVILEKQELFGGSTAYSGGIAWIPNNPLLDDDSEEASRTYLNHMVGEPSKASPMAKRDMFLKEGPRAVQFLLDQGVKLIRVYWPDYYSAAPGGHDYGRTISAELFDLNELGEWRDRLGSFYGFPGLPIGSHKFVDLTLAKRTWKGKKTALRLGWDMFRDKVTGARRRGSGNAVQGRMLLAALKAGIPLRMGTEVLELVTEAGAVTGVKVKGPDGVRTIGAARGVLLNAGGFSRNQEMRDKYQPQPSKTDWTMVNPGDTGDVMQMAMALGADVDCMEEAWWTPGSLTPEGKYGGFHVPGESGKPHIVIVGPDGRRVANEAGSYMEFGQRMYAKGAVPSWAILESRALKHYSWGPVIGGKSPEPFVKSGYLVKGDTLEDLARKCDIDIAGFLDEMKRFNGFAARGVDEDFGRGSSEHNRAMGDPTNKPNPSLGAIEQGPFYATQIWPLDVGTSGGLVTDEYARVITTDGKPIPGLYAAGNITAPVVGHSYPGAGASIGGGIAFGYVAARHAMQANEVGAAQAA
jgi:3-oxosteroid 1-dehydrogenase